MRRQRYKYMKGLKEYMMKDYIFVKEGENKNGYIGYLFIKDVNFYYIYEEKDGIYMQDMGPVNNKLKEKING